MLMNNRIITAIGIAAILLSGASCQRQELNPDQTGHAGVTFTANGENNVSKAGINEGETEASFVWAASDAIGVSDGTNLYKADLKAADAGKESAAFAVTETVANPASLTFAGFPHANMTATTVSYPASYSNYVSGAVLSPMLAVLPEGEAKAQEGYDYGDISFKHIGGMVKVVVPNVPEGTDAMVFTANGDVKINGTATVKAGLTEKDILENTWKSAEWAEGTSSVEFKFTALTAAADMVFFVPVPEGTTFTTEGFSVTLKAGGTEVSTKAFPFKSGYTIGRAKILRGVELDSPVTVEVKMNTETLKEYAPTKLVMYNDADGIKASTAVTVTAIPSSINRFQAKSNQSFTLSVLPSDYNMEDFWVVVELKRTGSDNHLLYIPTKHSNVEFKSGGKVTVDLSGLSVEMNDADWYVAGDLRLATATGYAYGDANTYFIQCKNGSTYTGATYTVNADIPDEVTIDYRARGNFFNVEDPEGVTFDWFKLKNGTVYTPRITGYEASGVVINNNFTITHNEAARTVTVKNTGAYAGAPVLVMKKGDKILWAWSFWNIAADGTSIEPIDVGSYKFAPMDIGQPTTNAATWIANKSGSNPDVIFRMTHLYQYGRYAPVFWTTFWSVDGLDDANGNFPCLASQLTMEEALANPVGYIIKKEYNTEDSKWSSEMPTDIWGSNATSKEGYKTVYDPCPKGWRVPSIASLKALASQDKTVDISTNGNRHFKAGDMVLQIAGYVQAKRNKDNGRPTNYSNGTAGNGTIGSMWGNVMGTNQAQRFYWQCGSDGTVTNFKVASMNASNATPVRCIVDTENR